MASPFMTTDDVIASAVRRALIPTSQSTFTTDDFIAFANEELALGLVPSVLAMKQDYFLFTEYMPVTLNQQRYQLPDRAIGNKVREISYMDPNGNVYEMTRITVDDVPFYNGPNTQARIYTYYIENNEFVLVPELANGPIGNFLITYYMRPNQLVQTSAVAIVKSFDPVTGDVFVDKIPTNYTTASLFDIVQIRSPHKCLAIDRTVVSINTTTNVINFGGPASYLTPITPFNSWPGAPFTGLPMNFKVGDRICLASQTDIPQVPSDLHVVLAHRVAARCLEALGDQEGLQAANQKLGEFEQKTQNLIDDRVEAAPLKCVNRHAILRSGLLSRRFRFRG
jgi:hypothetical protein